MILLKSLLRHCHRVVYGTAHQYKTNRKRSDILHTIMNRDIVLIQRRKLKTFKRMGRL